MKRAYISLQLDISSYIDNLAMPLKETLKKTHVLSFHNAKKFTVALWQAIFRDFLAALTKFTGDNS
ncbi:MAG: hypothetical protein Q8N35_04445 [Methylococcaceae bacterium]|nr:hypothetical protein [Methylococcaceae bacterium]